MRKLQISGLLLGLTLLAAPEIASAQETTVEVRLTNPVDAKYVMGKDDCLSDREYEISWRASQDGTLAATNYEFSYYISDSNDASSVSSRRLGDNDVVGSSGGNFTLDNTILMTSSIDVRVNALTVLDVTNCDDAATDTTTYFVVKIKKVGAGDDEAHTAGVSFDYDADGPTPPTISKVTPGNNNIKISWSKSTDDSLSRYEVLYFIYDAEASEQSLITGKKCNNYVSTSSISQTEDLSKLFSDSVTQAEFDAMKAYLSAYDVDDNALEDVGYISTSAVTNEDITLNVGLSNGVCTLIAMRAINTSGIKGALSNVTAAEPISVNTFADEYDGAEQGGYCFIATAAYGSYAHPAVHVLRAFRDRVMKRTALGTAMVAAYYRWSPALATVLAQNETARKWVQLALVPVALLGLFFIFAPLFGLLMMGRLVWRNRRRVPASSMPGTVIAFILLLSVAAESTAQAHEVMRGNGPRFAASVKGGPYLPVLHEDTAFDTIYGHQEENTVYNLGVDLILFDAFGEAGVGTSLGFMQFVGKGRIIQEGVSIASQDTTVFNILPLTAEVFYRLTYFNDEFGIPLSPYLRGGLAYYLWWNTNDAGETDLFYPKGETTEPVKAEGGKYGYTASVGVALELNAFEPSSAQRLEHTTGISSSSLFIEYETTSVNNFGGDGFDLSNTNVEAADGTTDSFNEWRVGLYLEF